MSLNLNISESRWTQTVVKIGIVGSVIVFPVGIVILTYHLCCGRRAKEKGMFLQYPCIITHFFPPRVLLVISVTVSYMLKKKVYLE